MNKRQTKKALKRNRVVFIDGMGDKSATLEVLKRAKANGRSDDVFVLNFSASQGGSFNPETGEFTSIKTK